MLPRRLKLLQWYRGLLQPGQSSPLQILMIQATSFCNIDCQYCYLPNRAARNKFDLALIEPLFGKLLDSGLLGQELTVVWHAGEPLVLPVDYYREAFTRIAKHVGDAARITHHFQTNGMLLTSEYCALIREFNVRLGVSIDGPAFIHDAKRKSRNGQGTHARAMAGIELLKTNHIEFTTISVITAASLDHVEAIFAFLSTLGTREIGFNIDEAEGINTSSSLEGVQFRQKYAAFMKRLLELSMTSPRSPRVREFAHAFNTVFGSVFGRPTASSENNPFSILSVSTEGRLTTYSPELLDTTHPTLGDISFGTVSSVEFTKVFNEPRFLKVNDEVQAGIAECKSTCGYFSVCGGGAPANKLTENGSFASAATMYCDYRIKIMTDLIEDFVSERFAGMRQSRGQMDREGASIVPSVQSTADPLLRFGDQATS